MTRDLLTFFIVFGLIVCETASQGFLQHFVKNNKKITFYILGIIGYAIVGALYYFLLNLGDKLAVANSYFNAGSAIGVTLLGWLYFGQTLTIRQIIGVTIIIIGTSIL